MDKALNFIGICKKAGALEAGEEAGGEAVRRGKARLVLVASDAAENTRRHARNDAEDGNVAFAVLPYTKEELGQTLGRRDCAVLTVTDMDLAAGLVKKLSEELEEFRALAERFELKQKRRRERQQMGIDGKTKGKSKKGGM